MISFLFAAALATADPPMGLDLEALLAKPVSPGVIALLVHHTRDARGAARVTEALSHPDAAVRAVAARVAGVAPLPSAGPTVRRALESESDRSAAAEQLRAALFLMPPGDEASLIPAARKHELAGLLAEALGNTRGPAALPLLDALREAGLAESQEAGFLASVTRRGREQLNVVAAAALRTANAARWSKVLSLARQPRAEIAPGMVLAAITSSNPGIRAATYWHLALTFPKGTPLSPELEAALAATPEATAPDSANADAAFALVVLRRAQRGREFGGDWADRVGSGTGMVPEDANGRAEAIAGLLTPAEVRALTRRQLIHDIPQARIAKETPAKPAAVGGGAYGGLLFTGGLPPGTLRDILAVTGCKPAADLRVGGLVVYRPDGRPRQISVADEDPCVEVARPTLGLTLAPRGVIDPAHPERPTVVIVPLDPAALDCAEQPEPSAAERVPDVPEGGEPGPEKIKEPRKVKNVAPWYPERAKAERRQGVVILEAIITASGCVRSARVLRSVAPDLDASAMIAVGQWRYTPTLLRGKPVPVIMTVTVNFRLS